MAAEVEFSVDAAVKELRNVSWPMLLLALDVDQEKETQIANECRGNDEKALSQLLRHWHDNHDSSWEKLAEALMSLPPFRRRGTYLYNKYVNPQCFTAEKIVDELKFVEDWFQLAHPFLDDSDQIRTAVKDTPEAERRLKVIKTWLEDYYDVPSWDEVANIVEDCFPEYEAVAEQLRKKYLPQVNLLDPGQRKQSPLEDLSSMTAFTETSDITDWYALGWFLGIDEVDLLEIDGSHSRTDEKRQAVLDKWLEKKKDDENWIDLSRAISKMRPHHGLSRRLLKRAQKKESITTNVETPETKDTTTETQEIKIESEVPETQQTNPAFQELRAQAESLIDDIGAIQITVKRLVNESNENQVQGVDASLEQVKIDLEELKIALDQSPEEERMQDEEEKEEEGSDIEKPSLKDSLMMSTIISKTEGSFDSDEDYSLNWEKYGCRLHIPRGSIMPGEKGKVQIYAIHNGPFKVPNELRLASAIYYVSVSHNLLKPASLEIQHCSRNAGESDEATILYIPDAKSGPPYEFEILEDGIFNTSDFCLIQRSAFSIYAVGSYIIDNIKSLFGYKSPVHYGLLHLLVAKDVRTWKADILLIEYLNAHKEYYLKEQRNVVENDFTRVTLAEDVITITVSGENEAAEIIKWKGHSMKIVDEWEITSSTSSTEPLQLSPDDISENLPSKIRIDIVWICPQSKPRRNKFRIHINGSAKPYSFPVTIPQPYKSLSFSSHGGSADLSSFDEGDESENLQKSPSKCSFIKEIAKKVHCTSKEFACHLLDEESMLEFQQNLKSINGGYVEEFMLLFDIWEKKGENVTWRKIMEVLRTGVDERNLHKILLRKFNDSVFETEPQVQ